VPANRAALLSDSWILISWLYLALRLLRQGAQRSTGMKGASSIK
jgi:hypothetical protein